MWRLFSIGLTTTLACAAASLAGEPIRYATLVVEGQAAPDCSAGVTFTDNFHVPRINANGQIWFYAGLSGEGVDDTNDYGVFIFNGQGLRLGARKGDPAPLIDGGWLSVAWPFALTADNHRIFQAYLTGPGIDQTNNQAIFHETSEASRVIARSGEPAPSTEAGTVFSYLDSLAVSHTGQIAFQAGLGGPAITDHNSQAFYAGPIANPQLIARGGDVAPDTGGRLFGYMRPPVMGSAGHLAFSAVLAGDVADHTSALFYGTPGNLRLAVGPGAAAPGTAPGTQFTHLECTRINALGQMLLVMDGALAGPGVGFHNDDGIWAGTPDALKLVARSGDIAPGTIGKRFNGTYDMELDDERPMFMDVTMSDAGHVAFVARLTDDQGGFLDEWGIWAGMPGDLRLITLHGSRPLINAAGQIVYCGDLDGEPALFAADLEGHLAPLVWPGQQFDLGDGQLRTLRYWDLYAPYTPAFGDDGRLVFGAMFTDSTQALLTVTVPEPGALWCVALAAGCLGRRGRS